MERKKRPRIEKKFIGEVVIDDLGFGSNKSSGNARKVLNHIAKIEVAIWCDKHYYDRAQFGDENGKREGIEEDKVKELVCKAIPHLIYYSLKQPDFNLINFKVNTRYIRVVLKDIKQTGTLNVVVEFHHVKEHEYEATVITAMQTDRFVTGVGQYFLEFDQDTSYLMRQNITGYSKIDEFF